MLLFLMKDMPVNSLENFSTNNIANLKNDITLKINAVEQYKTFIKKLEQKLEKTKNENTINELRKQIKILNNSIDDSYVDIEILNEYIKYYNK